MDGSFIYALAGGLCLGIAAALLFGLGIFAACILLALAVPFLLVGPAAKRKHLFIIVFLLCAAALGVARTDIFLAGEASETLSHYVGHAAHVVGVVSADPDRRDTSLHVNVRASSINGEKASGTLLAIVPPQVSLAYGDTVEVSGTLATPQAFVGDNGILFDYPSYLRVQGISAILQPAQVDSARPGGWSLMGSLLYLKHAFNASLERVFPEPDASLFEGILLGERRGLPDQMTQALVAAGLIHIVILAGYALGIVSDGVLRALSFVPQRVRYPVAALLLVLFVLMTGAAATTVRAAIMATVALVALYLKRPSVGAAIAGACGGTDGTF